MKRLVILEAALVYAEKAMPVVPMRPGEKVPLIKGGAHAASIDYETIINWWKRWPNADIALACGAEAGFDALDVDKQHGGIEALARLFDHRGVQLAPTSVQQTPSGGFHLLFQHRPGLRNRSGGQGDAPPGLDCRTKGAMIRTTPTVGYRWLNVVEREGLPPWPDWLAAFYQDISPPTDDLAPPRHVGPKHRGQAQRYLLRAIEGIADQIRTAAPGHQQSTLNNGCFRIGRLLAALPVISADDAIAILVNAGLAMENETGRESWTRTDVHRIVQRGIEDGRNYGAAHVPEFNVWCGS